MLAAACCNESKALNDVAHILKHRFKISPSGADAVCFAAIEPVTKQLLLGRWDESGSSVTALPVACELNALVLDWTACMEASKALLHRTVDTAQVAKWTDSDRRAWWSERAASDAQIESLLFKLEALLGPFKFLLSGDRGLPSLDGAMGKQRGVFTPNPNSGHAQTEKPCKNSKNSNTDEMASKMEDEDLLDALNALKVTELRQQLKESKLSVIGKKSELISRIQEFKSKNKNRSLDVCMYEDPQSVIVRSVSRPDASISSTGGAECQPVGPKVGKKVNIKLKPTEDKGVEVDAEARNAESMGTKLNGFHDAALGHTVLILDETLQQIPWEVLPCLRSRVCSRMPSFALLLHMLTRHQNPQTSQTHHNNADLSDPDTARSRNDHADLGPPCRNMPNSRIEAPGAVRTSKLQHTWYVLDPEGNLPATRATMSAFLQPYVEQYGWMGYTGEIPSEEAAK
jgi:Peptidase family C50/SAP domain